MKKPTKDITLNNLTIHFPAKEEELLSTYYREFFEPLNRLGRETVQTILWFEMKQVGSPDRLETVVLCEGKYCGGLHLDAYEDGKYALSITPHEPWENESGIYLVLGTVLNALASRNGYDSLCLSFPRRRKNVKHAVLAMGTLLPEKTEISCTAQISLPIAL